jgi:hypothetical protein
MTNPKKKVGVGLFPVGGPGGCEVNFEMELCRSELGITKLNARRLPN